MGNDPLPVNQLSEAELAFRNALVAIPIPVFVADETGHNEWTKAERDRLRAIALQMEAENF